MKVLHLTFSDHYGGANIAGYRLHKCLETKIFSRLLVFDKNKSEKNIIQYFDKKIISIKIKNYLVKFLNIFCTNKFKHSYNLFNSGIVEYINKLDVDIVHMHWINNELISIEEISKIKKKIIWTFHDMWPMCGTEHYTNSNRYITGYYSKNKDFFGLDFPKYIWNKKKKYFNNSINIVSPSLWLKKKISKSYIFKKRKVNLIRYAINTRLWKPNSKIIKHKSSIKLLFCAVNFISDSRKGFYPLIKTLNLLATKCDFELCTIGDSIPKDLKVNFIIKELKHTNNEKKLVRYFNNCEALLLPSTQDNFPNVGLEALCVGIPVISSKSSGMHEVISNKKNGIILDSFNVKNLKKAIHWVKKNRTKKFMRQKIHANIDKKVNYETISKQMILLYSRILNGQN